MCVRDREREFNAGEDVEAQTFLHTACGLQIDNLSMQLGSMGLKNIHTF